MFCDQETDEGGWTVFQRRQDGSVDFYLDWEKYKNGFGDLHGEFWLGNDNLHRLLTVKSRYELRIDIGDFDNDKAYAKYNRFMVGPESDNYRLTAEVTQETLGILWPSTMVSSSQLKIETMIETQLHVHRGGWVLGGITVVTTLISTVSITLTNKTVATKILSGFNGRISTL